jgi:prepilin-type N-terminal cleavage/methylation domain-containing protein/prepilin-type processing-associated H-X9-DG protein
VTLVSAFTLVELLAVIAIVGVLSAIIIPVVGKVRRSAQAAACLSNLRQLQTTNILYATEHNGRYLPMQNRAQASGQWYYSDADFSALLSEQGVLATNTKMKCPTAAIDETQSRTGYGYNKTGVQDTGGVDGQGNHIALRQVTRMQIPRPSQTIAFADGLDAILDYTASDSYAGEELVISMAAAYRHNSASNVVYWDGRAALLPRQRMAKDATDLNKPLWTLLQ